jgi:hypothetical protein
MKSRLIVSILALLVVGATAVSAQMSMPMPSQTSGLIRGMDNPARIPDAVAYRLVITSLAGDNVQRNQRIAAIGLSAADQAAMATELGKFRTARDAMRNAYNQHQVDTQGQDAASITAYQTAVANLVEQTRKNVAAALTSTGFGAFAAHVQREKTGMTISETEAQ